MKTVILILLGILFYSGINAQKIDSLEAIIHGLKEKKKYYENEISDIDSLVKLNNEYIIEIYQQTGEGYPGIVVIAGDIYDRPTPVGAQKIGRMEKGDKIVVFDKYESYYLIKYSGQDAYYPEVRIEMDIRVHEELLEGMAANNKKIEEQKRVARLRSEQQAIQNATRELRLKRDQERKARIEKKYTNKVIAQRIYEQKIWIGMTKEMLIDSWGRPGEINRTVNAHGTSEQFIYTDTYVYVDDGLVTAWQD